MPATDPFSFTCLISSTAKSGLLQGSTAAYEETAELVDESIAALFDRLSQIVEP